MKTIPRGKIERAIEKRIGARSHALENKFRRYEALMDRLTGLRKTSAAYRKDFEVMARQLDLLILKCDLKGRTDAIGETLNGRGNAIKVCAMAEDKMLHETDLEKIKNRVLNFSLTRFEDFEASGKVMEKFVEIVTEAAEEQLLLRRDATHAILLVRALGIDTPDSVMGILGKPELLDLIHYQHPTESSWIGYVKRIERYDQYIIARELVSILDPENKYDIMKEMYGSGERISKPISKPPEREEERINGINNVPSDMHMSLVYSSPSKPPKKKKKKKPKKKNANGKQSERIHLVDFPEEIDKVIRDEGFEPSRIGHAIVYGFNLAGPKKALGSIHFEQDNLKKNFRKIKQNWKKTISFLRKYDLIKFHGGSIKKGDVSFNPKPDNEIGKQIAKSVIAYMQTVS